MPLHTDALITFFTRLEGTRFIAARWGGWQIAGDLHGLVSKVPEDHSVRDAAGGSIADGFYRGTVVTPGDWLIVATDTLPKGSWLLEREVVHDSELRVNADNVPPGLVLAHNTKALEILAQSGLLVQNATRNDLLRKLLERIQAYLIQGVWR